MSNYSEKFGDLNVNSSEPAASVGVIGSVLTSVYIIVNNIWPNLLNNEVQNAVTNIIIITTPIVISLFIRRKVFSPATVFDIKQAAKIQAVRDYYKKTILSVENEDNN